MTFKETPDAVPAVEMQDITLRFPGVLANDHVNFTMYPGEIHALLGENGAGKSTLMNVLTGLYKPQSGEIRIHGKKVSFNSPKDAIANGIGMVHQHFMLVENQTVTENILIGLDTPRFALNLKKYDQEVSDLADQFGIHIDPTAKIWQLSVGEQQRVEILKILYRGADILIMDEPTAVLAPQEADELIATLKGMAAQGKAIAFISHKLAEVKQVADKLTVLRRGRVTAERMDLHDFTRESLASLMVGREVIFNLHKCDQDPGREVLRLEDVSALNNKNLPALRNVDLALHEGEILGIAGVAGNGQSELVEVITGLRPCTGNIWLEGKNIANKPPAFSISQGLAHIPEDRIGVGSAPNLSLTSNIIMKRYDQEPISHNWQLDYVAADTLAGGLKDEYDIQAPSVQTQARKLSGGNLQKLILARELSSTPRLIVAMQPTRGLDVGAIESVQQLLLRQREQGCAILLVSEDLDELLALSDRIAVMYEGHVVGTICSADFDITKIGLMMTGTLPQDLPPEVPELKSPAPGSVSDFDSVLDHVKDFEQIEQASPAGQPVVIPEEEIPPSEEPSRGGSSPSAQDLNLSEKERVLRKVLGENYNKGDEA
ncbi:MAG: ABC transporter ATP-binding protein [Anaerolineaceae bacterium]|nr:ABC transporter ATP-binding protein [Anaerolineaceae bacterium]MDD4578437.1 ABC transporter ATP-binding protein [Anaerolineaceae bacterium]